MTFFELPQRDLSPADQAKRRARSFWTAGRSALVYLVALTLAELFTTLVEAQLGLLLHGALLVALLFHASRKWDDATHGLLLSLSIAPMIRLVSLSLPLVDVPLIYWYLITSLPLFLATFVILRIIRFPWSRIGLNLRDLRTQALVGLTGLILGFIEYVILRPVPLIPALTLEQFWIPALILLISTGFAEELIFRGMMQNTATDSLKRFGLFYVAAVFAVLHIGYKSVIDVVFVFLVALYFGWIVIKTRSIVGVTVAHGLTNIMLFLVTPFLGLGLGGPDPVQPVPIAGTQVAVIVATTTPDPLLVSPTALPTLTPPSPATETMTPTLSPTPSVTPAPTHTPTPTEPADLGILPTYTPVVSPTVTVSVQPPTEVDTLTPLPPDSGSTATPGAATCAFPAGWEPYIVQSGDNLFRLAVNAGLSLSQLQEANCIADAGLIHPGQTIYLPLASQSAADGATAESGAGEATVSPSIPLQTGCQTPLLQITSPVPGSIQTEVFWVHGTASLSDPNSFDFFKVELRREGEADYHNVAWSYSPAPETDSLLALIDPAAFGPGVYEVTLTVVDKTGNYPPPCAIRLEFR